MAKKRRETGKPPGDRETDGQRMLPSVPDLPDASERMLFDIGALLEENQFHSINQANEFLQQVLDAGGPRLQGDVSPLQKAQAKAYDAWQSKGDRVLALAREALEISPDCTDAYVLLAHDPLNSEEEALRLFELAIEIGERTLGPKYFEEHAGRFWELVETRPYMRALAGKAHSLTSFGKHEEAVACCHELLRLDPRDHLRIRYLVTKLLFLEGKDAEAGQLLEHYEECTAMWAYLYALWLFRTTGESQEAAEALTAALNQNHLVAMCVFGALSLPKELPDEYGIGSKEEAIMCVADGWEPWLQTPGALDWFVRLIASSLPHP